jgi:hypothetical protein
VARELVPEATITPPDLIVLDDVAYVSELRLWQFLEDDSSGPRRDAERDALTS